jgi:hypothetical protein
LWFICGYARFADCRFLLLIPVILISNSCLIVFPFVLFFIRS